ncbi:MAG: GDP-mannose dehydrogenase [Candidatus Magasanikbacteria bacterium]|nr:GDP-mannose dehydrogenase [Candidatus Magasanikbacteria bacterium]|tara:strand:- start:87 stop:1463 length:1377 start_codon:yes stop_codon:yes gene_type:complete
MNILYIGGGFVGACSAAVSAASGHNTLVFDIDTKKMEILSSNDRDTIESCLFEKGLGDLLVKNTERIVFTSDYAQVDTFLEKCDVVFMCLPTPEIGETGESDISYYNAAAEKLAESLCKRNAGTQEKYIVIANKSTVPIDMVDKTAHIMDSAGVKNYGVVSNPEFLVEGKAVQDSLKPDRVVVGASTEKDFSVMRQMYQRFFDSPDAKYIEVNPKEAAAGKLLANFYLFNKLAVCFDVIGRTCEAFDDLQFEQLRKILIGDKRIGGWGFYNSMYAGGSCFIKDTRSLAHQLQKAGKAACIVEESYLANKRQLTLFLSRAKTEADISWEGKTVALIGLSFKRDTNDVRNSPSIDIVHTLKEEGVKNILAYDPVAKDNFAQHFPDAKTIVYVDHEYEAVKDADVVIVATDWPQFRGLADMILENGSTPLIMDGRRMLQHRYSDLQASGCNIIAVGSPYFS